MFQIGSELAHLNHVVRIQGKYKNIANNDKKIFDEKDSSFQKQVIVVHVYVGFACVFSCVFSSTPCSV